MKKTGIARSTDLRRRIADEAARILATTGAPRHDFRQAKKKAARRLGITGATAMPTNQEIQAALVGYQHLFRADSQPEALERLRTAALDAMGFMDDFMPRLVGAVLDGTADRHSEVNLHVFSDTVEDIGLFLEQHGIPAELRQRRLNFAEAGHVQQPEYRFLADEIPFALTVFSPHGGRTAPLSPVDGRPMRRASAGELRELVQRHRDGV